MAKDWNKAWQRQHDTTGEAYWTGYNQGYADALKSYPDKTEKMKLTIRAR